jgi:hypothetical protein
MASLTADIIPSGFSTTRNQRVLRCGCDAAKISNNNARILLLKTHKIKEALMVRVYYYGLCSSW